MSTCTVTVWPHVPRPLHRGDYRPCGEPVTEGRWCAKHNADRARLGGGDRG